MSPEEKIEAAQKLIDEARAEIAAKKRNWPEKIEPGMLFESEAFGAWISLGKYGFACISGDRTGSHAEEISGTGIAYLGHARDLIKIADDAHEPTGAELVGKRCEYCDIDGDWDHWDTGVCKSFTPGADRPYLHQGGQFRFARLAR